MAKPRHDWFLKEWLDACQKKQADVVKDLDWNKAKVSLMARGLQAYTREEINELAEYLNILPFELLMHPEDAHRMRRLKADMISLVRDAGVAGDDPEAPEQKVSAA
jgi:hypothetical protein